MRIWLVVILGAILSGISYAAYEIELRVRGSDRVAALPLTTSDKDSSAQNRESILGKTDETAAAVEPGVSDESVVVPADEQDERMATVEPSGTSVAPPPAEIVEVKPTFDVVSVDPDGTAVVAGRAAPGASVTLQIGDKSIGSARASDRGEWVIVPDELIPGGAQSLSLESTSETGGEPVKSDQVATIVLPESAQNTVPRAIADAAPRASSAKVPAEQVANLQTAAPELNVPVPVETLPESIAADSEPSPADMTAAEPESGAQPALPDAAEGSESKPADMTAAEPESGAQPALPDAAEESESKPAKLLAAEPESEAQPALPKAAEESESKPAKLLAAEPESEAQPTLPEAAEGIASAIAQSGAIPAPAEAQPGQADEVAQSATIPAPSESEVALPSIVGEAAPAPAEAEGSSREATDASASDQAEVEPARPVVVAEAETEPKITPSETTTPQEPITEMRTPEEEVAPEQTMPEPAAQELAASEVTPPEAVGVAPSIPTAPAETTPPELSAASPQAEGNRQVASLPQDRASVAPIPSDPAADDRSEEALEPDSVPAARALADQPAQATEASSNVEERSVTVADEEALRGDETPPVPAPIAAAPAPEPAPQIVTPSPAEEVNSPPSGAMVVLSQPGEPSRVLQSGEEQQAVPPPITFDSVDYDDGGRVIVAGQVEPGADVRAYIDNEILGDARADDQGRWTLRATRHIDPGAYELRVDRIDQEGLVIARARAPFHPVAPDIVERARERGEVVIQPGDNLWNIARDLYGQGTLYTVIYNANTNQIIDPDLIYPGQLLVTPGSSGHERERAGAGNSG